MKGMLFEKLSLCHSSKYMKAIHCNASNSDSNCRVHCMLSSFQDEIFPWQWFLWILQFALYSNSLYEPCKRKCKENTQAMNRRQSLSFHLVHSSLFILSPGFLVLYLKVIWLAGGMMPRPARLLSSIASCWFSSNCISQMSKATHTNCFSSFIAKKRPGHCVAPEPKGIR